MNALLDELKTKIIETLNLEGVTLDDLHEDEQLVGGELGIDSIDVLELVMMIDKDYAVKIDNKEIGVKVFSSVKALAAFISENSPKLAN